jgi:hypothetical protein
LRGRRDVVGEPKKLNPGLSAIIVEQHPQAILAILIRQWCYIMELSFTLELRKVLAKIPNCLSDYWACRDSKSS